MSSSRESQDTTGSSVNDVELPTWCSYKRYRGVSDQRKYLRTKNHIFSNFRGAHAGCAPLLDPPLVRVSVLDSSAVDWVKPKNIKLVFVASVLSTQHLEEGSAPAYTTDVVFLIVINICDIIVNYEMCVICHYPLSTFPIIVNVIFAREPGYTILRQKSYFFQF
jgi:hypothetical protein